MRASMARLTPRFSANRAVREYAERCYLPAAAAYRGRAADRGALGARLVAWRQAIAAHWQEATFGALREEMRGPERRVSVQVRLGGLDPDAVRVELYAEGSGDSEPERHVMEPTRTPDETGGGHEYAVAIPATRPPGDYTPRLLPRHSVASVPLEAQEILWLR
jgi:starch phosphorylase